MRLRPCSLDGTYVQLSACGVSDTRSGAGKANQGCPGNGHLSVVVNPSSPEAGETLIPHNQTETLAAL